MMDLMDKEGDVGETPRLWEVPIEKGVILEEEEVVNVEMYRASFMLRSYRRLLTVWTAFSGHDFDSTRFHRDYSRGLSHRSNIEPLPPDSPSIPTQAISRRQVSRRRRGVTGSRRGDYCCCSAHMAINHRCKR